MKGRWPMSTFDYIANSLNVKGNVIKKCIHSEQQIEFIMELNRAVVQCPNCHARPIESRITVGKGLLSDPFCTNRLLSDYIKEDTFALAAVVHSLKPSRSCSVINANQKICRCRLWCRVFKSAASQI